MVGGKALPVSVLLATAVVAAAICLHLVGAGDPATTPQRQSGLGRPATFTALRTPPEPMAPRMRSATKITLQSPHPGLNFAASQLIPIERHWYWLIPGGRGVCLVQVSHGAMSCTTPERFRREGIVLGLAAPRIHPHEPPRWFCMVGLVPRRYREIHLRAGRRAITARPRQNGFEACSRHPVYFAEHPFRPSR